MLCVLCVVGGCYVFVACATCLCVCDRCVVRVVCAMCVCVQLHAMCVLCMYCVWLGVWYVCVRRACVLGVVCVSV